MTASYGGDLTHEASTGKTWVAVALPASTNGCVAYGHGMITAASGDLAGFGGIAAGGPSRGAEFYRDIGPANPFRLRSLSVDALTCSADTTAASVFGRARLNDANAVEYRIDIELSGAKGTFRIRLDTGYDSGVQPIRFGDLHIHIRNATHR